MIRLILFLFIGCIAQDFDGPDITAIETTENPESTTVSTNETDVTTSTSTTTVSATTVTLVHPTLFSAIPGLFISSFEPQTRTTTILPISELMKKRVGAKLVSQDVTRHQGLRLRPTSEKTGQEKEVKGLKGVPKPEQTFKDEATDELESNPNGDYLEENLDITEEPTFFTTSTTTITPTETTTTTPETTVGTVESTTTVTTTATTVPITTVRQFQPGLINEVEFLPGDDKPNQTPRKVEEVTRRKGALIDAEVNSISRSRKRPPPAQSEEFGKKIKKLGGRRIAYKKRTLVVHDVGNDDIRSLPPPPPGAFIIQLRKSVSNLNKRHKRETNTTILVDSVLNKEILEDLTSTVTPLAKPNNTLIHRDAVLNSRKLRKVARIKLDSEDSKSSSKAYGLQKLLQESWNIFQRDQPIQSGPYIQTIQQNLGQIQVSPFNQNVGHTSWQNAKGRPWTPPRQQPSWEPSVANRQVPPGDWPVQTASPGQSNPGYWNQQGPQFTSLARQSQIPRPAVVQQFRPPVTLVQQSIPTPQPILLLNSNLQLAVPGPLPRATVGLFPPGPPTPIIQPTQLSVQGKGALPKLPCDGGCELERHNRRRINSEGEFLDKKRIQDKNDETGAVDSATSPELLSRQANSIKKLKVKLPTSSAPLLELSEYPDSVYDDEVDQRPITVRPLATERDRFRFEAERKTYDIAEEKRVEMVPVGRSSITLYQLLGFAMDAVDSKMRSQRTESNPGDLAIEAANSGTDYDYKTEETVNVPTSIVRTNRKSGTPYFKSAQNLMSSVYDQINLVHYNPRSYEFEAGTPVLRDQPVQTTSVRPITFYATSRRNYLLRNVQLR